MEDAEEYDEPPRQGDRDVTKKKKLKLGKKSENEGC